MQDAIGDVTSGLRAKLGPDVVRWVSPRNIHLTLKFLGDVSESGLRLIQEAVATAASTCEAFDVVVDGLGFFPNARRPRVLWVGLTAPAALELLQGNLDVATARLGYQSEGRGYSPHLTIGRTHQNATDRKLGDVRSALKGVHVGNLGIVRVDSIHLFRSDLTPSGAVYTSLWTTKLATPGG